MKRQELVSQIMGKQTCLCVGLDTDPDLIPEIYQKDADPVFAFNKAVIDATIEHCVAYKMNIAFYECQGPRGWISLEKTLEYIPKTHFTIADAKRGDIGNTSRKYADTFFKYLNFDAVTVAPYMGSDSVMPFLDYTGKWVIVLGLTSNPGSADFQYFKSKDGRMLYEEVILKTVGWGTTENLMFVTGATHAEELSHIRTLVPDHFLLVPGVGAQGGNISDVISFGGNKDTGLLINSSRDIIYRSEKNHSAAVKSRAESIHLEMSGYLGNL